MDHLEARNLQNKSTGYLNNLPLLTFHEALQAVRALPANSKPDHTRGRRLMHVNIPDTVIPAQGTGRHV
jgi:hypothetical protein